MSQETRERAERDRQTFFVNQTTCLHEAPFGRRGDKVAFAKRKFAEWNPGSLNFDLFFVATKIDNRAPQRFGANENKLYRVEHLPGGLSIRRLVHVHHYIRAVKGNNRRIFPCVN